MLRRFLKKDLTAPIDGLIDDVLAEMRRLGVDDEAYPAQLRYLERLYALKAEQRRSPVSLDTIAIVGGNLAGILLIVAYEQKHVFNSKAITQVLRPKSN